MTRNSHQIVRQWRLLRALEASRHGLTMAELHDAIDEECDPRTLYRDLEALQAAGFPLTKEDDEKRWRVLEPREGGWVVPLEPTELIALALAENLLVHTGASTLFDPLVVLRSKLLAMMSPAGRTYFDELKTASLATMKAPAGFGDKSEILSALQDAIQEREVVTILHHKPGDAAPKERVVEPYATWFTEGGFYVIAYCRTAGDFRHFALQRILAVTRRDESFEPSPIFDPAAYTRKGFGAYHGPVQRIVLEFGPAVAFLVRERRFHHTQRLRDLPAGGVELTMEAAGLPEVAAWIAGFGGDVVPHAPAALREAVRGLFERGLAALDRSAPASDT
ncbi:MAG: WYL domain-containing protein [Myxococcota bacterium]